MPNSSLEGTIWDDVPEGQTAEEAVSKMALSPLLGRVCAFSMVAEDGQSEIVEGSPVFNRCIYEENDEQEKFIVQSFFDIIFSEQHFNHALVTFNGTDFDIPFMFKRGVILGVDFDKYPKIHTLYDYASSEYYSKNIHIDVLGRWGSRYNRHGCTLNKLSEAILGDKKIEINLPSFAEMIKTEDGRDQIMAYCAKDVILTLRLFKKLTGVFF